MKKNREYKLSETLRMLMAAHPHTGKKTTQKELAEYLGIRPQSVSAYICGESVPSAKNCLAMADYFGVSADYLLVGFEDKDMYRSMADAANKKIYERLCRIAVLCAQGEDNAHYLMSMVGSGGDGDVD